MGKKKKAVWTFFARGTLLSLGIYLAGILLLAAAVNRGMIGEGKVFPVLAVLCVLSGLAGELLAVRNVPWGKLLTGILSAALFALTLTVIGACLWQSTAWSDNSVCLLLCILGSGVLAGVLGSRKGRGGKRLRKK